jgi:hypothetical protein
VTRPREPSTFIIYNLGLRVEEFVLEILKASIVQRKLALEHAV